MLADEKAASEGGRAAKRRIFAGVRMSAWAWRQRVRGAMLAFAGRDLPKGKVRRDWKAKAHAFAGCGTQIAALACRGCETVNTNSGTLVATCGLRICPICARRKAQKLRHRLMTAWLEGKPKRDRKFGLYFLTFTMRYDPTDAREVSADGLLARKNELLHAWASIWRQYLKPRAPKDRGGAACRAIEVGASGMVHMHVLYCGRRPDVDELRARWLALRGDSPIVNVSYCRNPKKAIVELAKYVTKGASPAKLDVVSGAPASFMDAELAVRVEIAFSGDRMVQCYGAWLGISVDDDEDDDGQELSAAALHKAPCPNCGLCGEWKACNYTLEEWFERFGERLDHWRPRIGGAGPRDPREAKEQQTPTKKPKEKTDHERSGKRLERSRRRETGPADGPRTSWASIIRPDWTATGHRLVGQD